MSEQTAVQITDRDFHQEIIDLCTGTHWVQGHLETHCWVPENEQPIPEGEDVEIDNWNEGARSWRKAQWCLMGMVFKLSNLPRPPSGERTEKVAVIKDDIPQTHRIIDQLWNQLPEEYKGVYDLEDEVWTNDGVIQIKGKALALYARIADIEHWNDSKPEAKWPGWGKTDIAENDWIRDHKREDVINLVTRARDAITTEGEVA